ncbi:hypothetical protein vBBceSLY1_00045 [Bacillus phage vB_BceS_LY1]|uniref:Uncharacterized protein n=1 Tax=Bacillus phage vB_BceS_LY1 TaxID=2950459 RepID=A0AAE9LUN8_9CAUD|nr:hypothetical protein vBBceSLY1_00045 [Bacillus phage vB_BceS_LY1]
MARQYGYCYDNEGKFTEIIPLENRPIIEKHNTYRDELKEVVTEEKLCELHQSIKDGTHVPVEGEEKPVQPYECPNCVMHKVDYVTVQVPEVMEVIVGYEPILPPNCTFEVCPDLIFEPVFKDGKWVKLKPDLPVEPTVPVKSEVEKLREEVNILKKLLDEMLIGGM